MVSRLDRVVLLLGLAGMFWLAGCASQGGGRSAAGAPAGVQSGEVSGVDASELTSREHSEWWAHVSEQLAPCPDQPVSIAQCVNEGRPCRACLPAAQFLLRQVELGRTRSQIEQAFLLRFDPEVPVPLSNEDAPWKGAAQPVVTIAEWADFQCPFCALAAPFLDYAAQAYPDHVRVVYHFYPMEYHQYARAEAQAAFAAQQQGKFWPYHDLLYKYREKLSDALLRELAQQVGLDLERFDADRASPAASDRVENDRKQADALGLRGTPMLYVNGRYFDLEQFDLFQELMPWVSTEIEIATGEKVKPRRVRGFDPRALPSAGTHGGAP